MPVTTTSMAAPSKVANSSGLGDMPSGFLRVRGRRRPLSRTTHGGEGRSVLNHGPEKKTTFSVGAVH
jgi:hypothetical protein